MSVAGSVQETTLAPSAAYNAGEGAGAIRAIVGLLLASPPESLEREARRLDAALAMVCARLGDVEKAETGAQLSGLAHLFPLSLGELAAIDGRLPPSGETDGAGTIARLRFAPPEELMRIAQLPAIDEATTAILVFRGTSDILAAVTANPGARFAVSSFTTLIELAPGDRRIKENLSVRIDLPERLALRILPFLNEMQLVRMLAAGASIDTATAAADLAAERDVYRGSGVDPSRPLDDTIAILCNDARVSELSELLSERLGITLATAMNLLCGRLDHSAGILLRAAGASTATVQPVLTLRQRLECRPSNDRRAAHEAFTRYSMRTAREMVIACAEVFKERGLSSSDFDFATAPKADRP